MFLIHPILKMSIGCYIKHFSPMLLIINILKNIMNSNKLEQVLLVIGLFIISVSILSIVFWGIPQNIIS